MDVSSTIGEEYFVLKFPTAKHHIGSEWSRQFNATGKGSLSDDKIVMEKSLKQLDKGTADKVALGLAVLSTEGSSASAGINASVASQVRMSGLQIIKPASPGYIDFKPGITYVGEALRLESFNQSKDKNLSLETKAGGSKAIGSGSADLNVSHDANDGISGEGLVVGYLLQTVDDDSYSRKQTEPVPVGLDAKAVLKDAAITASASFESIVPGSGKSLPKNLLWACKRAASQKNAINAAWVVTVAQTGADRKTLKIAFPAHPEIEDCSEYEGIISTGINSANDMIERTRLKISLQKGTVTEMLEPVEFSAELSAAQETFKIKTVRLQ
ncbi:hypothetical protein LPW11_05855 [Geomonas sp. RF6]|uniref:hypothetical protein n=1 Tax=Geomonas sp. RF6 TaxID=2897342 RepID=UPI001E3DEF17|nr:hypothetical protein [Geomonas sp. RF6]UFS71715.1 hypothetical protein LPW11_05855 [Geomonas sp. RF6]